jgi:uncharacterized protein DUF5666
MSKMNYGRLTLKIITAGIIAVTPMAVLAVDASINVRGTITRVDGNTLEINQKDGSTARVRLADNAKIAAVTKASLFDIKPGSFIGTAATPRTDGTLQAIEIHIFPDSMRGTGEGNREWDLAPKSSMTNGTVSRPKSSMTNGTVVQRSNKIGDNKVSNVEGNSLTVEYNGGTRTVTVTPTTEVVALVPGDQSELKPHAQVFISGATRDPDGGLKAERITVGKDGVAPPM